MPRTWLWAAALLGLLVVGHAQARTWTDQQGRTMEATFVRVSGDTAYFDRGGERIGVKLSQLSDKDQRYIRRQTKVPKKSLKKSSTVIAQRNWVDDQGNTTKAKFVRVFNDNVVLLRGGRALQVPFWKLSKNDQDYVEVILKEQGREIPPREAPKKPGTNGVNNLNPAGNGNLGGGLGMNPAGMNPAGMNPADMNPADMNPAGVRSPLTTGPSGMSGRQGNGGPGLSGGMSSSAGEPMPSGSSIPGSGMSRSRSASSASQQLEQMRQRMEQSRQQALADMRRRQQQLQDRMNSQFSSNSTSPSIDSTNDLMEQAKQMNSSSDMMGGPTNSGSGYRPTFQQPMFEEVKKCGKCLKVVPDHVSAGGNCPHCGAYFSFEQDRFGKKTYAKGGRAAWVGGGVVAILAVIGVIVRVIIVFARS